MLCDTRKKIVRAGRGGARERAAAAQAPAQPGRGRARRGDSGETLALLVVWPALLVAILVLLVHAFIVTNAQAEAEVAASAGLRAAWRSAANEDFLSAGEVDDDGEFQYTDGDYKVDDPHPKVRDMAGAAQDAVARAAATEEGWRWWTPGAAEVQSDWCHPFVNPEPDQPSQRPSHGDPGWVRVVVSGEVFGPLAALWPDRLDLVYAAATGPAVVTAGQLDEAAIGQVPASLPVC